MYLIRAAAAVLNQTPLAWRDNAANIRLALQRSASAGASIVCLPELCVTGYGCEDAFFSPGIRQRALAELEALLPYTKGLAACIGVPLEVDGEVYNAAAIVCDQSLCGFVLKQFLAVEGVYYEARWFRAWRCGEVRQVSVFGKPIPAGDVCFSLKLANERSVLLGVEICEDAWAAKRPGANFGAQIVLNPNASHFSFGKHEIRKRFVLEGSRAFKAAYISTNLVGNEAGRIIFDGGALIAQGGKLLAQGPRLFFSPLHLTFATLDLDSLGALGPQRVQAEAVGGSKQNRSTATAQKAALSFVLKEVDPQPHTCAMPDWENSQNLKHEEFARAVSLGLFDYLRKSRAGGFVVSLSGGADSTAVAVLTALMVRFSLSELGIDGTIKSLHLEGKTQAESRAGDTAVSLTALPLAVDTAKQLTKEILTCVYQASSNSGQVTLNAAREVASAIGADFIELQISSIINSYTELVERALGQSLSWSKNDIELQNIQARARGPSVWLIANLRKSILLATSNRSEAAVGYTTMDGDTCGGLSPIAGIDKAYLREWLKWMESTGPQGAFKVPELGLINQQEPTAELRPPSARQTDEQDLMPYEILDRIERYAIRDKCVPKETLRLLANDYPAASNEQLKVWVSRFYRLWSINQWKRERYAPSFHLDDESLDPKTWCRFPILSGGFSAELSEPPFS